MAERRISVDAFSVDQFSCPMCLDLLKDPLTLPCGHNSCKVCINNFWNQEDEKGVYSCPQCRDTFTQRPLLGRNNMLAEVVEKLKKTEDLSHCYAGPGDVECDFCTERKHKAVKSCLMCLTSFCEAHLKSHLEVQWLKKHTLVEACSELQEKICSKHDKVIEIYCRTDRRCICSLCLLDNHKGHDAVSLSAERTERENDLKEAQMKTQELIQEKQKKMQELKEAVNMIKDQAQKAVEENEIIFTEIMSCVESKRLEVTELIRAQEKAELIQAEQLLKQLEQEIVVLVRKVSEMEQLSQTRDHHHFLQSFQSLCVSSGCEYSPSIDVYQNFSFDGLRNSLSDLKKRFKEFCEEEFSKIPSYAFYSLTLDPNTANYYLRLSEKNRVVAYSKRKQLYSDNPNRFDFLYQVLSKESVCGRCYWEVEWNGGTGVSISVSYKEIMRKGEGKECEFGRNSQSWSLWCSSSSVSFYHNDVKTELNVPSFSRIRVCVDYREGRLSFYSVSDTMRLIHKVRTTFTQPLYAGFGANSNSVLKLCDMK